jgi:pimeloyl-ACP methyl ester carboxylesterase
VKARTLIVYVHGLWLTGHEAWWLRRRLARALGAEQCAFAYASVRAGAAVNVAALAEYLTRVRADVLHLVGHSLGGVLIVELFENPPALPPGRIVLLGPPLNGSRAAAGLARLPIGRRLLGATMQQAVLSGAQRAWRGDREIGIIAGDRPLGLGRLVGSLQGAHDGTVAVAETRLEGATDHIVLPVSHSSMVLSPRVAAQSAVFLREGRFAR